MLFYVNYVKIIILSLMSLPYATLELNGRNNFYEIRHGMHDSNIVDRDWST